eukprot:3694523-Pyramimonas_sp.AAC.1
MPETHDGARNTQLANASRWQACSTLALRGPPGGAKQAAGKSLAMIILLAKNPQSESTTPRLHLTTYSLWHVTRDPYQLPSPQ